MVQKPPILRISTAMWTLRWLGFSVLWSTLLLLALVGLFLDEWVMDSPAPSAHAAARPNTTQFSTIAFSETSYVVSERVGSGEIVLLVSPPSSTPITVNVASDSTRFSDTIQAKPGLDFEGLRASLVISPGVATYTLALTIIEDEWVEGDEHLLLFLGSYDGVEPGVITETHIIIHDNDVAYLHTNDMTVEEEAENVLLLITQSVTSTLPSQVTVRTIEGSARAPADFDAISVTATISPDSTSTTITIPLHGDNEAEGPENFIVLLENAINAQFANEQPTLTATVTLSDDDFLPEVTIVSPVANEASRVLAFVATLNPTWTQTVTVEYTTVDGTATAPADYLATSGRFTIPAGALSTTILVPVNEDARRESDETLSLVLSNPVQAILSAREVEGVIQDSSTSSTLYLPGLAH